MRIDENGKVGIGTATPYSDSKLHINASGADASHIAITATGSGTAGVYFDAQDGDLAGADYASLLQKDNGDVELTNYSDNDVFIKANNVNRLQVSSNGVQVLPNASVTSSATTGGNTPLAVKSPHNTISMFLGNALTTAGLGANEFAGDIRFNGAGVNWGDLAYYPNGGDAGEMGHFRFSRANGNVLDTTPDAKVGMGDLYVTNHVGVGTNSPSVELDVTGNIKASGSILSTSDQRYKTNIQSLSDALDIVLQLRGVRHDWKQNLPGTHFSDKTVIGVLAQEVEPYLPEVVHTDSNGYKSVDYSKLTPLLIEAIKSQQQQLDAQEKRLQAIEARLDSKH